MGIIIVLMALLIIGIILLKVFNEFDFGYYAGLICITAFIFGIIISSALISIEYITENKNYKTMLGQKNTIEYRLEQAQTDKSIMVNGGAYNDALEYNKKLRNYKMYGDTFWLGWFYSDKIAELDYIDIIKESEGKQ